MPPPHAAPPLAPRAPARERAGLVVGPVALVAFVLVDPPSGVAEAAWRAAGVLALMATWWATEAVPPFVTSLLPLLLFPLLGVASIEDAAAPFAHPLVFLFLGGFLLAAAFESSGMHRRLALLALRVTGTRLRNVVLGLMATTAAVSMWVNNTATAMMTMPVALALASLARSSEPHGKPHPFGTALVLGVAFSAAIGGLGTLVGTPANSLFAAYLEQEHGVRVSFAEWMMIGVPAVLVLLPLAWLVLTRVAIRVENAEIPGGRAWVASELAALGPATPTERRVAAIFFATVALWVTLPFLAPLLPGLPLTDAGVAMVAGVALFLVPAGGGRAGPLLDAAGASRVPWTTLVLFGGGLSLADAMTDTGLAASIGAGLASLGALPLALALALVALAVVAVSEFASNTATAASLLPVGAAAAVALGAPPAVVAMTIAVAASGGFVMPVATPPNALAYATGLVPLRTLVRAGLALDLLFVLAGVGAGMLAAALPGFS